MKLADNMYTDVIQKILDKIHKEWQARGENVGVEEVLDALPEYKAFIFAMAKLNHQVENGGWEQWIDNGYAGETGDFLQTEFAKVPPELKTLRQVISIFNQVRNELGIEGWGEAEDALNNDPLEDSNKFEDWVEDSEYRYHIRQIGRDCDRLNIDVGNGVDVQSVYDDYYGTITVGDHEFEDVAAALEYFENHDDEDGNGEIVDTLSRLNEIRGEIEQTMGRFHIRETLRKYDNMYYKLTSDMIFKDVAHFVETVATEEDMRFGLDKAKEFIEEN